MRTLRLQVTAVAVVFVALLGGLLVGAVARRGPATQTVRDADAATRAQNLALRDSLTQLTGDLAAQQRLADGLAPVVLNGRLRGVRIVVLSTPSGSSDVDGVVAMLGAGGARVTGTVELTAKYTDPARATELLDLATRALPPSVTGGLPTGVDGVGASTALLAAVLVARTPAVVDADIASVLAAYTSQGYLKLGTPKPAPGDAVVLVGGDRPGRPC